MTSLRARAGDLERERDLTAQAARRAERARIAREMHDVVAHRVSNIVVTATALELLRALRAVHEGHAMLDPAVTRQVIDAIAEQGPRLTAGERAMLDSLTAREVDVLRLIGRGLSNADIGAELFMTEGTVKGYVSAILAKLGADNRVQAARVAYRAGLDA